MTRLINFLTFLFHDLPRLALDGVRVRLGMGTAKREAATERWSLCSCAACQALYGPAYRGHCMCDSVGADYDYLADPRPEAERRRDKAKMEAERHRRWLETERRRRQA